MVAVPVLAPTGESLAHAVTSADYVFGSVPLWHVNVLTQERKTYDDLEELAHEFAANGWLEPPLVTIDTASQAKRHLAYVNRVFLANHQSSDLVWLSGKPRLYGIWIAGHRRLLANRWLWENGCQWCHEEYGPEELGVCFRRHQLQHGQAHLPPGHIEVKVFYGLDPRVALLKQCSENSGHRLPPSHETAESLDRHLSVLRADLPDLSMAAFARIAKVRPEQVRRARRYCTLPANIQADVEAGRLAFGLALELGRLIDAGASHNTVDVYHQGWIVQKPTTAAAAREVKKKLGRLGGWSSLDSVGDDDIVLEVKKAMRQPFEGALVRVIYAAAPLFERARGELAAGRMGLPDGVYRDTTVMNAWRKTIVIMEALLPELHRRLGREQTDHDQAVLTEVAVLLDELAPSEPSLFAAAD